MPGTPKTIAQLEAIFATGAIPTQQDYHDLFASLPFYTEPKGANLVFCGPTTGADAAPTFRSLVAADIPTAFNGLSNFTWGATTPVGDFTVYTDNAKTVQIATQYLNNFYGFVGGFNASNKWLFQDNRTVPTGIEYAGDYSAHFTARTLVDKAYVDAGLGTKQATLVSGTNIKTINSTSLLGSGNISIVASSVFSDLTAADATNTINNASYAQEWQWDTLGAGTGLLLSSSATDAASNTQTVFRVNQDGANASSTQTTYAGYFSNTKTGTASTNVGLYATASGGTTNIALQTLGSLKVESNSGESVYATMGMSGDATTPFTFQSNGGVNTLLRMRNTNNSSGLDFVTNGGTFYFANFGSTFQWRIATGTNVNIATSSGSDRMYFDPNNTLGYPVHSFIAVRSQNASSTATQRTSGGFMWRGALWDGAATTDRGFISYLSPSTTVNLNASWILRNNLASAGTFVTNFSIDQSSNAKIGEGTSTASLLIGGTTLTTSAALDVQSTTQAFIPPRMTEAQRDAIGTPSIGMIIYNTDTNLLNFYNGSAWGAI